MNDKTPTSTDTSENMDPNAQDMRDASENSDQLSGQFSGNHASTGGLLRASRIRRNEALSEVASDLRIRQVYIEAIENDKYEVLPGAIYAIGFIRSYAEYLGLDGEEVVRRYKTETATAENRQDLTFPTLVPEHGIPGGAIVMVGLVLAAIGYGSWYFVSSRNIFVTEQVPAVPEKLASLVGEKPVATEPLKPEEKQEPPATETAADKAVKEVVAEPIKIEEKVEEKIAETVPEKTPEKVEAAVSAEPVAETIKPSTPKIIKVEEAKPEVKPNPPKPVQQASAPEPKPEPEPEPKVEPKIETTSEPVVKTVEPEPEPKVKPEVAAVPEKSAPNPRVQPASASAPTPTPAPAPATTGSSRITLRAVTDSYIQVRDNDADQLLITRLLKKGQSYDVPDRTGLSLITGNAGALEILVDGTAVPSIGPIGAVRRNVILEAEKLKDGSAVIE